MAPALDLAEGFRADSTMAKYFNSKGMLFLANFSSNIGK